MNGSKTNFFPDNLSILLPTLPNRIRNLFGTYQFDHELKTYITAQCPHTIDIDSCLGCDNDLVAELRLKNRVTELTCPYFLNGIAKSIEFVLNDDLPDDEPFAEFAKRLDTALTEANTLIGLHATKVAN